MSSDSERLDRRLAGTTDLSRKQARQAIRSGDILVDGVPVTDPSTPVAPDATVELAGTPLRSAGSRYFMLNKPAGVICANRDRRHATVIDLLDEDNADRLHVAGRLDLDSTGLTLITDDGAWAHRLTAPNRDCRKVYLVVTAEPIAANAVERFARGMVLQGEKRRTRPAMLELLDEQHGRVILTEGKYRQIRRMFAALGNEVVELHRVSVGAIVLDDDLAPGEYRALSAAEIATVA